MHRNSREAVTVVALVLSILCGRSASAADRPNIVLVMADDQGWGDMAYNGHPRLHTPHFDEAARSGLRFDRFYAAAPVCSPTRASVMTGRHPNRMGVFKWGYPLRPQEVTVAESLRDAGYATGHFGKWHLGSVRRESRAHPGHHGFEEWLSAPNFFDNDPVLSHRGTAVPKSGESSMVTVDAAIEWIRKTARGDRPFFAVVWFGSPHAPHRAAEEDRKRYVGETEKNQHFYGEITGMDRAFGKLRSELTELGLRDRTVLWYTSDNGALPKVGSSGGRRGHKGKVYEGGLLVPAIMEWPARIPKPRVSSFRCNSSDIFPTLAEIAGARLPTGRPLDGVSLVPVIDGQEETRPGAMGFWDHVAPGISTPSEKWMRALLAAQRDGNDLAPHESSQNAAALPSPRHPIGRFSGHSAWIDGDWKLHRIEVKPGGRRKNGTPDPVRGAVRWELYNLRSDERESRDLVGEQPARATRMRQELEAWLASVVQSLNGEDYSSQP